MRDGTDEGRGTAEEWTDWDDLTLKKRSVALCVRCRRDDDAFAGNHEFTTCPDQNRVPAIADPHFVLRQCRVGAALGPVSRVNHPCDSGDVYRPSLHD
jgi:hypothetical protein